MMQFNRYVRILLLSLFALLQGVAPVAHAHVDGHHDDDHSVHLHTLDSASPHAVDATQQLLEHDHGAVINMPPEFRVADLTLAQPVANEEHLCALREYSLPPFPMVRMHALAYPPYQLPLSQAPPV